jgi:hypothetical protein
MTFKPGERAAIQPSNRQPVGRGRPLSIELSPVCNSNDACAAVVMEALKEGAISHEVMRGRPARAKTWVPASRTRRRRQGGPRISAAPFRFAPRVSGERWRGWRRPRRAMDDR